MVQPGGNKCAKGARAAQMAGQLTQDMVSVPKSALGAARAATLSTAQPLIPLRKGRGAWGTPAGSAQS